MSEDFKNIPSAVAVLAAIDALELKLSDMPSPEASEAKLFELADLKEKLRLKEAQQDRALKKLDKLIAKVEKIEAL